MTGAEFIRKIERFGKNHGLPVNYVPQRGKGSHGTLYLGDRFTMVRNKKDELKKGTLHGMLKQLGIAARDIG